MNEVADVHRTLMRSVLDKIGRDHLVLKGGTALMFGYGIERYSRDLDFDANRPVQDIEKKLKNIDIKNVSIIGIDTLKNTDTLTRYRIRYTSPNGLQSLKIEISYRQPFDEHEDVLVLDGIRFASLPRIIGQKLQATHDGENPRTRARDLYDLDFLSTHYGDAFTTDLCDRLIAFTEDPEMVMSRYRPAFIEDDFEITDAALEEMVLRLNENARKIKETHLRPTSTPETGKTTVEHLCKFAEIPYVVLDGPPRAVTFVHGGGHRKIPTPGRQRGELYVDLDAVPTNSDKQARAQEILAVLATDLDCYEAGESLAAAGLMDALPNGKFVRRERGSNSAGRR